MSLKKIQKSWLTDQIAKSGFFHQKLHEWGVLEIAYELENIKGENLEWDRTRLNISEKAWNKVIHRGIKPIMAFAHPQVIKQNPRRLAYYRMLAMVSQKSMNNVGLPIEAYETGRKTISSDKTLLKISKHFNKIISLLIESDEEIDPREFDIWRGMAAGSQAQGSWQNIKGNRAEVVIRKLVMKRLKERKLIRDEKGYGKRIQLNLKDGRIFILGSEPDIGIYKDKKILEAVEIKGGIDTAGVLERFGAALKSLRRAKRENSKSITVLIIHEAALTKKAKEELRKSKSVIDYFFRIEEVLQNEKKREKLFKILEI